MSPNTRGALGQPALRFTSFTLGTNGVPAITAAVQPLTHYVILTSTNLTNWSYLTSVASSSNTLTIAGPSVTTAPAGFQMATTPR